MASQKNFSPTELRQITARFSCCAQSGRSSAYTQNNRFSECDNDTAGTANSYPSITITPIGNGHINDTYLVEITDISSASIAHNNVTPDILRKSCTEDSLPEETGNDKSAGNRDSCVCRYILQRINDHVFTSPEELMENMLAVTEHLGGPLRVIPASDGLPYYKVESGPLQGCWRMLTYIDNTYALETLSNLPATTTEQPDSSYAEDKSTMPIAADCATNSIAAKLEPTPYKTDRISTFREIGRAYGEFIYRLSDMPADGLHVTIDGFHYTRKRFNQLLDACCRDPLGRKRNAEAEIRFALEHESDVDILNQAVSGGEIPVRIVHNDTKLNNILLDRTTGKAACVIDLDTVMPGLSVTDFGDAIRSGASTGREDQPGVELDLDLYHAYAEGFIAGCPDLTTREIELLPTGAKVMTLECGIRFLTDYLEGDTYFRTDYPDHNLIRCRSQFALLQDIEAKWSEMHANRHFSHSEICAEIANASCHNHYQN